ncbi:MAG: YbaN family protein [Planctomycetota bacterium]
MTLPVASSAQRPATTQTSATRWAADQASLELARRVLADEGVRSLSVDRVAKSATVYFADHRVERAPLATLADRFRVDSMLLASAGVAPLPVESVARWEDDQSGVDQYVRAPKQARGWRRVVHLTLAGVWFTLAVLGAILPGLPCTCFLLLCSYSLCRSSRRLHERLLASRWFGPTLRHWRAHRGVRPGVKTRALTMLIGMVGASLAFAPLPTIAWWAVAITGAIGATCVGRLRVIRD